MSGKIVVQLTEMGFSQTMVLAAIRHNPGKDNDLLITWIIDNQDKEQQFMQQNLEKKKEQQTEKLVQISSMVNQELVKQLKELGHSGDVSQKALFMSGNKSVQSALSWIQQHKNDPDFQQKLYMIQQEENKPKLSVQEAKQKAKELQIRLRDQRKKREEQDALQRQRNRIKGGKQLVAAKREFEQAQRIRAAQLKRIQKEKDQRYRRQVVQKLQRQKAERLGKTYEAKKKEQQQKKALTPIQNFEHACQIVKTGAPFHIFTGKAQTSYQTIKVYIKNALEKEQEKFRKINCSNKAFQSRIAQTYGAQFILQAAGFRRNGETLELLQLEKSFLRQCIGILDKYIAEAAKYQ